MLNIFHFKFQKRTLIQLQENRDLVYPINKYPNEYSEQLARIITIERIPIKSPKAKSVSRFVFFT